MEKCKTWIKLVALILLTSVQSFSDEVGNEKESPVTPSHDSKCILKSNIYYLQDDENNVILPLNEAQSRKDCEKKIDYSQINEEYDKLSKVRCDVYATSKNGGCKKTVGYIDVSYKNYSDIISGCKYYLKMSMFVKETPLIDIIKNENNKMCSNFSPPDSHLRYVFRINDPKFMCSNELPSKTQCITKKNHNILERVTEFGNGWKKDNVIYSDNLGVASSKLEAEIKCKSIGGELPSYNDIRSANPLLEVIFIRNGWLRESYSNRDYFDKDPDTKIKNEYQETRPFPKKVEVKKDAYNVYCIKKL